MSAEHGCLMLQKMISHDEINFVGRCREMISDLTGEDFIVGEPEWLHMGGMRLQLDGYCSRLKMAIDYQPTHYALPPEMRWMYINKPVYLQLLEYISEARLIKNSMNGIAVIPIPRVLDDTQLRKYLLDKLHELTKFRVWVGSPRCKCKLSELV